jgi:hypothetical protein
VNWMHLFILEHDKPLETVMEFLSWVTLNCLVKTCAVESASWKVKLFLLLNIVLGMGDEWKTFYKFQIFITWKFVY